MPFFQKTQEYLGTTVHLTCILLDFNEKMMYVFLEINSGGLHSVCIIHWDINGTINLLYFDSEKAL